MGIILCILEINFYYLLINVFSTENPKMLARSLLESPFQLKMPKCWRDIYQSHPYKTGQKLLNFGRIFPNTSEVFLLFFNDLPIE